MKRKWPRLNNWLQRYSEDPGSKERGGQYQINRNEKTWDPVFLSTAFRLKKVKYLLLLNQNLVIFLYKWWREKVMMLMSVIFLRIPPVTDAEINQAIGKTGYVRSKIIAGTISFNEAATKYSEDESAKIRGLVY